MIEIGLREIAIASILIALLALFGAIILPIIGIVFILLYWEKKK